jgi:hypothetical protein
MRPRAPPQAALSASDVKKRRQQDELRRLVQALKTRKTAPGTAAPVLANDSTQAARDGRASQPPSRSTSAGIAAAVDDGAAAATASTSRSGAPAPQHGARGGAGGLTQLLALGRAASSSGEGRVVAQAAALAAELKRSGAPDDALLAAAAEAVAGAQRAQRDAHTRHFACHPEVLAALDAVAREVRRSRVHLVVSDSSLSF